MIGRPMRVLLCNPPGRRRYLRDYYCCTVSKAGYYWHPMDLLVQSGHLAPHATLGVLDAIADGLSPAASLTAVRRFDPDLIVSLVGAQSLDEDLAFLRDASAGGRRRVALSGEPVREGGGATLRARLPEAFLLEDFTSDELARWVARGAPVDASTTRPAGESTPRRSTLHLPRPRHELFLSDRYHVPFDGGRRFASVLTAYGCPHRCAYCNSGASSLGYAVRDLEDIAEELDHLARRGDVPHVFFRDMDFTSSRRRALRLCGLLRRRGVPFTWNCYGRPDELDDELCEAMSRAGCRLIQLGLETFDEPTLARLDRPMDGAQIERAFRLVRRHGMRSGAHLILGLPGEGWSTLRRTWRRVVALNPDYVSFNVLQRRSGAPLAAEDRAAGDVWSRQTRLLSWARRGVTWGFYLRPRYVLQQLTQIRSPGEARSLLRSGLGLLWQSLHGDEP
jgi:hypothetical protein